MSAQLRTVGVVFVVLACVLCALYFLALSDYMNPPSICKPLTDTRDRTANRGSDLSRAMEPGEETGPSTGTQDNVFDEEPEPADDDLPESESPDADEDDADEENSENSDENRGKRIREIEDRIERLHEEADRLEEEGREDEAALLRQQAQDAERELAAYVRSIEDEEIAEARKHIAQLRAEAEQAKAAGDLTRARELHAEADRMEFELERELSRITLGETIEKSHASICR